MTYKVLITGSNGQLGYELQRNKPDAVEILATDVNELNITNVEQTLDFVNRHELTHIINAAAYTAVDKTEDETTNAFNINQHGAANLVSAAKEKWHSDAAYLDRLCFLRCQVLTLSALRRTQTGQRLRRKQTGGR